MGASMGFEDKFAVRNLRAASRFGGRWGTSSLFYFAQPRICPLCAWCGSMTLKGNS
jgi:hypothetical protein